MYSWKTIRTFCLVLLLLPVIHLVYLVSRDTLALLDASPEAWNHELEAYARADSSGPLPTNPIVVVGGRRVSLWTDLEGFLAPRPVLMRGLGDDTVDDITHIYSRLLGYYRPDNVVLLPSNSEFHIRDNKSADDLVHAIQELFALDDAHGITRRIYIFTPVKTPLHPGDDTTIDRAAMLLEAWSAGQEKVTILDSNAILANGDGRPKPDYFRSDGINLSEEGYLRLSLLLQTAVERENQQAVSSLNQL